MDNPKFNVVTTGSVLAGFDADAVLLQLQQQLKLPETKARVLIAGKTVTVKRDVERNTAEAYCKRLQALGVDARVEAVAAANVEPSTPAKPSTASTTPSPKRYFLETALPTGDIRHAQTFLNAVRRANLSLAGTLLTYLALIFSSVGLLLFYMVRYASFLKVPPVLFSVTVYSLASIALTAVVLLLSRPLFIPRASSTATADTDTVLSPMQEPALFSFVAQLCEKLALKMPEQIAASAAARNDISPLPGLKNVWRGDYRLTLSLPALENASLRQFAATLAGDLATQTRPLVLRYRWMAKLASARLADCRASRDWLARRIETLAQTSSSPLARIFTPFITPLRKLIEYANHMLEKFTACIDAVENKLQRPFLFEQDHYNALIGGSNNFAASMIFNACLTEAVRDADTKNREDRIEGGLVDDLPTLIKHYFESADENFARALQRRWDAEAIPRRDEPPIVRERIEQINHAQKAASIDGENTASSLLQQREALAREVTLANYRARGLEFDAPNLMPVDDLTYAATQDIQQRQQAAVYFNDWFKPHRFWILADYQLIGDMPLQDASEQLSVCVNEIRRLSPDRAKLLAEYERLQNQLREILLAQHVLAAGKKFAFRYLHYDGTTLVPILEERQNDIAAVMEKLAHQETVMGGRITLGLRLSGQSDHEVRALHDALRLLHETGNRLYKLSLDCFQLEQLLQRHHQLHEADYSLPIKKLETKIDDACTLLIVRLNDIPYPLDTRHRSLKTFAEAALAQPLSKQHSPILARARRLLDVLYRVNEKLSRQAAEFGTIAEEAYRIEPIKLIGG